MINVDRLNNITPHCETVYKNTDCPYIELGCTGCKITNGGWPAVIKDIKALSEKLRKIKNETKS